MEISPTAVIGAINLILIIVVGLFNYFSHQKLVGNDLHHLSIDVKEIKERQLNITEKVNILESTLSYVRGKCDMNSCKRVTRTTKKTSKKI